MKRTLNYLTGAALVLLTISFLAFVLWLKIVMPGDNPLLQLDRDAAAFCDGWVERQSGRQVVVDGRQNFIRLDMKAHTPYTLTKALPEDTYAGQQFCFRTCCNTVTVYAGGEKICTDKVSDGLASDPQMYRFVVIDMPLLEAGTPLELELYPDTNGTVYIQYLSLGSANSVYLYLQYCCMSAIFSCAVAILVAVMALALFVYNVVRRRSAFMFLYLSLFSILSAGWIFTDSGASLLLLRSSAVEHALQFGCYMLLPATFLQFIQSAYGRRRGFIDLLCLTDVLLTATAVCLYQSGVVALSAFLPAFDVLITVSGLTALVEIVRNFRRIDWYFSVCIAILAACAIFSVATYYMKGQFQSSLYYRYIFVLFAIGAFLLLVRHIHKTELEAENAAEYLKSKQLAESRMMVTQINSHFFNNTMNTIRGLIKFDPEAAYKMTGDMSKYLRYRVNAAGSNAEIAEFKDELRAIQAYADICVIRYNHMLHMEYDLQTMDFRILTLSVEPFVENAIKHGIFRGGQEGTLRLSSRRGEGYFEVTVEDNGCGFVVQDADRSDGVGIKNVTQRMEQYPGCSVSIQSTPGEGTVVKLRYPEDL